MFRSPVLLVLLLASFPLHAQRKVLIIGIDGCRGDAIVAANTPTLDGLRLSGLATLEGNTHPPTWSGTGWSSMLTGVWEQKHKVVDNTFAGQQFGTWPHFFARLKQSSPQAYTASLVNWEPIHKYIVSSADLVKTTPNSNIYIDGDVESARLACDLLRDKDPAALFVYFGQVELPVALEGAAAAIVEAAEVMGGRFRGVPASFRRQASCINDRK